MTAPLKNLNHLCHTWLLALLSTLVLGSVSACSSDDIAGIEGSSAEGRYVKLNISVSVGDASNARNTRATTNPNGGENGNGLELGTVDENSVQDVTIILFQSTGTTRGINDENAANITVHAYCWGVTPEEYSTENTSVPVTYTTGSQPLEGDFTYGTYQVLAVANADLSSLDGHTLKDVREYLYDQQPYTVNGTTTTNFVMANAADATITVSENAFIVEGKTMGSYDNPFTATIDVERLAARIDFVTDGAEWSDFGDVETESSLAYTFKEKGITLPDYVTGAYRYEVSGTDVNGTTSTAVTDELYLTAVTPFNTTEQSRLFKYVGTPDESDKTQISSYAYLADEDPNNKETTGNVQKNYVVDPYFFQKTGTAALTDFYTAALRRSALDADDDTALNTALAAHVVRQTTTNTADGNAFTVAYTSENTFPITVQQSDALMSQYATGLRFDGYYRFSDARTDGRAGMLFPVHYYYYLRHSDPKGTADAKAVMRNGVVRNNIYRVSIGKVSEINNFQLLKIIIKVVPWQQYTHEEIVM